MSSNRKDILEFSPPPLRIVERSLKAQETYFNPTFYGLDNVDPDRPALYVANHTLYGMLDSPFIFLTLYREKGIVIRSLGDHAHYKIPVWRDIVTDCGTVPGTRDNCARLMEGGEHILVFPGGGREVAKRKGEENKVVWKTRTGFAAMAMEHGYPIIPLAALGADDTFDIHYDAIDFKASKFGQLLLKNKTINDQLRDGDLFMPFCTGIGPLPIPRPEKFYFSFGEPIDTTAYRDRHDNLEAQWQVRAKVMASLEHEMENLKMIRHNDTDKGFLRKLLTKKY